jgi:DNA topoisomerase-1
MLDCIFDKGKINRVFMAKTVVVVESPAKAKTISGYLGKEYIVLSSKGHVRDLEPKKGAVEPTDNFKMKYKAIPDSATYVKKIIDASKKAENLLLATDPDREGEAIAWHLCELLNESKIKNIEISRVVFHQITKKAIQEAIKKPRVINQDLVDAQQARRALDYLIGFYASPLLWKKIRRGLSAGRVQSPALCLIVNRENEIKAFKPQEYWTVEAKLHEQDKKFPAKLYEYKNEKIKQFSINNKEYADEVLAELKEAGGDHLTVAEIDTKPRKRNPAAPFTTSTLQQEAARKIGFSSAKTMMVAQQLYEGITTPNGNLGLITYMRTDAVSLASEAIEDIRNYISQNYGENALPPKPHQYKTKAKNAQEAHEAIRPTNIFNSPKSMAAYLTADQAKLYSLIWKRTLACQMKHATLMATKIDLECGKIAMFRASGSIVSDPGFLSVYEEGADDKKESKEIKLPAVTKGQKIPLEQIVADQHFTEPPPRYSEASLVKTLEEYGIGRPSTYASIIQTLKNREYVILEQKRFHPTDTGEIVCNFLSKYLTQYVDYGFTAELEDELDAVSRGEIQWVPLLEKFWGPFKEKVDHIDHDVQRKDVTHEEINEKCPECSGKLSIRLGKRGKFIGCDNYPECKYARSMEGEQTQTEPEIVADRKCPACSNDLVIKAGRYGKFIGCSNYPNCKHMEPIEKPESTGVACPKCDNGDMLKRKSRRGTFFYSCDQYPKCKYAVWNEPVKSSCSKCNWPFITLKETKKFGKELVCPECGDKKPAQDKND